MAERALRIVVVSWHFPPSQEIGGKVVWRLVKHLALLGCDVRVLVAPESEIRHRDDAYAAKLPPGLRIVRTDVDHDLAGTAMRWLNRLRPSRKPAPAQAAPPEPTTASAAATASTDARERSRLRDFLRTLLVLDRYNRWIKPAARALRAALAAEPADLVLSVSPVFQAHFAVHRARRALGDAAWYVWMHDPGVHYVVATGRLELSPLSHNALGRLLARRRASAERAAIESADRLVVTTKNLGDLYRKLLPDLRTPVLVPCGFDVDEARRAPRQADDRKLVFVYVGTIYSKQTPRPIVESLARLRAAGVYAGHELEVKFVGRLENEEGRLMKSVVESLGMGDVISASPQVPHVEALRIIGNATVGIAMAEEIVTQIPAKVYEYIALRRPVLALADGATQDFVEDNRIGWVCSRDGLDEALTEVITQWRRDRLASFEPALEAAALRYDMASIAKDLLDEIRNDGAKASRSASRDAVPA
jgi:glycosyltransferase involved in cell wall biosynthesis